MDIASLTSVKVYSFTLADNPAPYTLNVLKINQNHLFVLRNENKFI